MVGGTKKLAVLLLLIITLQVMFGTTDGWRRRRRRRYKPPPPPRCDSSLPAHRTWNSRWHGLFYYGCAFGYSLSYWHSRYRACQQDRIHQFQCRRPTTNYGNTIRINSRTGCCDWTLRRLINNYLSKCPKNGFITGIVSAYDKHSKNRRYWMRCCWDSTGRYTYAYRYRKCTVQYRSHGTVMNYQVPPNYVMTGVGYFRNGSRWRFRICPLKRKW